MKQPNIAGYLPTSSCPVKPIAFTESNRGRRYLRTKLDEWLAGLDPNRDEDRPAKTLVERMNENQTGRIKNRKG
jgi:hypothetical protein